MRDTDEESAFDFVAMVEESEKQMRNMYAHLPDQLCAIVEKILARANRIEVLERHISILENANTKTVRAADFLLVSIKKASAIAMAMVLLIPLVIGITFYVQCYRLNNYKTALEGQIRGLTAIADELKKGNPDGIEFANYGNGKKGIILPKGAQFDYCGNTADGRDSIVFIQSK